MKKTREIRPPGTLRKKGFHEYSAVRKPPDPRTLTIPEFFALVAAKKNERDGARPNPVDPAPDPPASPDRVAEHVVEDRLRKEGQEKADQIAAVRRDEDERRAEEAHAKQGAAKAEEEADLAAVEIAFEEEAHLTALETPPVEEEPPVETEYERLTRLYGPEIQFSGQHGEHRNPRWPRLR